MKLKEITDWAAVCLMLAPMAMLAAPRFEVFNLGTDDVSNH